LVTLLYGLWTGLQVTVVRIEAIATVLVVAWLLVPVLFPLYGLAALKALSEHLWRADRSWYSVEK
jgi:hypothetical protein